ncbi:MAG: AAA family ATPase, partial [Promethearchaeota archaeon]
MHSQNQITLKDQIWTEKYRPMTIQNLIGLDDKIPQLNAFIQKKSLPHLLLVGPPGTGKTSTVLCLLHDLFQEYFSSNVEEINANDSRDYIIKFKKKWYEIALKEYNRQTSGVPSLNFVFKSIFRNFSMMRTFSDVPFRVLILKDADSLNMDIQQALRRTMEKSTRTCRFCLICENLSKIIDPIRSRCVIFHFTPIKESDTAAILRYIVSKEKILINDEGLLALIYLGRG